jgi:katanin p60 ATPase-containing subunit A1
MIDLSSGIRKKLEETERIAQHYADQHNREKAAETYRVCAKLTRSLVDYASNDDVKKNRIEKAKRFLELAKHAEAGNFPASEAKTRAIAKTESQTSGELVEDEYSSMIHEFIQKAGIKWDEIGGLEETKREIQAFYALSMASVPEHITLTRQSGMLLYGPPGTGKTLLAAATSTGIHATFFNVKVSGLLSKYFGESTKLVSRLFEEASRRAPSVIFIDEIDSLTPSRTGTTDGAEKRLLSTLLAEMDGLATKGSDKFLLTIGATNTPWMMDEAILSRFGRMIYVPLPDQVTRAQILDIHLRKRGFETEMELSEIICRTEGYSGRDIEKVCADAVERMLKDANQQIIGMTEFHADEFRKKQLRVRPIRQEEFTLALQKIRPSTSIASLNRFKEWADARV